MATGGGEGSADVDPIFKVKWKGTEYVVDYLDRSSTVLHLKEALAGMTGVLTHRQKLTGFKMKGTLAEEAVLGSLKIAAVNKLMMVGSREETIAAAAPTQEQLDAAAQSASDVFDIAEVDTPIHKEEMYLEKIRKRVGQYEIDIINPLRPGRKLIVLDIDCTLFAHHSVAESFDALARPYLHEFLASAYTQYDIGIWSATSMKWVKMKLEELGMLSHSAYKISFMMDHLAMISVYIEQQGGLINTKPLGVLFGLLPQFSEKNTLLVDDLRRNFLMSPNNGIRIKAWKNAPGQAATDRELLKLAVYLQKIADVDDVSAIKHKHWDRSP